MLLVDELGHALATLLDDVVDPGSYIVGWDAGRLPAGVYFFHLQAGSAIRSRRMTVIH